MFNSLKKDISKTQEILKHLKYKMNNKEFERKNHLDLSTLQYATLSAKLTDI